jgi:hypothetical protein
VVSSLRLSNVPVRCASAGQTVTFKLAECLSASAVESSGAYAADAATGPGTSNGSGIASLPHLGSCRRRSSATGLVLLSPPVEHSVTADTAGVPAPVLTAPSIITAPVVVQRHPLAHWEFEAELLVLNHPAKIRVNYEPVVHVGCVKQSAKLLSIRKIIGGSGTPRGAGSGAKADSSAAVSAGHVIANDEVGNGERAICRYDTPPCAVLLLNPRVFMASPLSHVSVDLGSASCTTRSS